MYRSAGQSLCAHLIMITVLVEDCNTVTQSFYDDVINSLQLHQLRCSCGHSGCLSVHGYYRRHVHTADSSCHLSVMRVKCSECSATHAILLSSIVPYSQISLSVQVSIIEKALTPGSDRNSVCDGNPDIDENNVKSVVRRFRKHWQEKLRSEGISLQPVIDLIKSCFSFYSAQFMQIQRTYNSLFQRPTRPYPT